MLRACKEGNVADLRKFVDEHPEKKDYDVVDEENACSPFYYAVESDSLECVQILLSTKLLHMPSESSKWLADHITYLDLAIGQDSFEIVRLLLGCDPNFYTINILLGRDLKMSMEMLESIVEALEKMRFPFCYGFLKLVTGGMN